MEGNYIVKLNNNCNANCIFCADSPDIRRRPGPGFEELLQEQKKNRSKFETMIISGGEPTIYRRFLEYLDNAKKAGYKDIILSTNGFLLKYTDFTEKIFSKGVNIFQISFQTTSPEDYARITGVKKAYEYVTKGMENIKKLGARIIINTCIHKLNYKKLPEILEYLIDYGTYNIQFSFMQPAGISVVDNKSRIALSFKEVMPQIVKCHNIAEKKGYKNFYVENIPICVAEFPVSRIADLRKPQDNKEYYNQDKKKPPKCKKCIHYEICDGIWEAHLEQFGDDELCPIKK